MEQIKKLFNKYWPVITLALIVSAISALNYVPGTILTGWDNLHPEYNFLLNIKRSLFSVWQEYQGLGLLGGHAYSVDILRQLTLYALSSVIPLTMLRYLSMFFMLLAGTLGAYVFIQFVLRQIQHDSSNEERSDESRSPSTSSGLTSPRQARTITSAAFLGALFYLLNLATVQTFYAPFEAFTAHFAALPWLLFTSLSFVLTPNRKNTWFLFLALLFALPMAYIPTLFLVYGIALGLCLLVIFFSAPNRRTVINIVKLGSYIFLINAFWLLPFFYFTFTNSQVVFNSKINQMSTETIFLQNKEFGTLPDVALLKGFWFNSTDPGRDGVFTYMLESWREHVANPFILGIGYFLFAIVILGAVISIRRRQPLSLTLMVLLFFSFTTLAIDTMPFSFLNDILRGSLPLLNQAFRFPFTKFSILTSLTYAALFAITIQTLISFLSLRAKRSEVLQPHSNRWLHPKSISFLEAARHFIPRNDNILRLTILLIFSILLVIYTLPIFQGHLFYAKERLVLPREYSDLFAFLRTQDPAGRIANFPQYTFWGWSFYSWGYGGSGFLWYGIPQPILDRAFDVWSAPSENYYFELAQALYEKNPQAVSQVLDKYQITWLLLDKNIIYPPSPKSLFYDNLTILLKTTPDLIKVKQFGNLELYRVNRQFPPEQFVYTTGLLPSVNGYSWTNDDVAFKTLGMYRVDTKPDYLYPFRSLATVKSAEEQNVNVSETSTTVALHAMLPARNEPMVLHLPSYTTTERITPVRIRTVSQANTLRIEAVIRSPMITIGDKRFGGQTSSKPLFIIARPLPSSLPYALNINGTTTIPITAKTQDLTTTFFSLTEPNVVVLTSAQGAVSQLRVNPEELVSLPQFAHQAVTVPASSKPQLFSLIIPKITDSYLSLQLRADSFSQVANCDGFRNGNVDIQITDKAALQQLTLSSENTTACTSYAATTLPHDVGYIIQVTGKNLYGRPLHFWVENIDQRRGPIDTYLPKSTEQLTTTYLLPPSERFGQSYAFHFDNIAIGKEQSVNTLEAVNVYPFPYRFAMAIFQTPQTVRTVSTTLSTPVVVHPNESLYFVQGLSPSVRTLVLSQSFETGWKAYKMPPLTCRKSKVTCFIALAFPFLFGQEIKDHVKVNNWANGWVLPADQQPETSSPLVVVYLPQYLQYLGFIITGISLIWLSIQTIRQKRKT